MSRKIAVYVLFFVLISGIWSCRKKLESDYSYLYGKWTWIHTYRNYGQPSFVNYTPATEANDYSLEISKKCVVFYKNGKEEVKRKYKSISVHPGETDTSKISFFIELTRKDGLIIDYYPMRSYSTFIGYPFEYILTDNVGVTVGNVYIYENYFKKE